MAGSARTGAAAAMDSWRTRPRARCAIHRPTRPKLGSGVPKRALRASAQRSVTAVAPAPVRRIIIVSWVIMTGRVAPQVDLRSSGARSGHWRSRETSRYSCSALCFYEEKGPVVGGLARPALPVRHHESWNGSRSLCLHAPWKLLLNQIVCRLLEMVSLMLIDQVTDKVNEFDLTIVSECQCVMGCGCCCLLC